MYPDSGFTRDDVTDFYGRVAKWLLPHLKGRPVSFKRYPDTIRGESFWEKDAPSFTPEWVHRFAVPRRSGESAIHYIVIDDVRTLTWVASVGGIEIHPFLHRVPKIDEATHVVFDLDPGPGAGLDDCREVAVLLRDTLQQIDLQSFAKVSGSKGIQVYVPLNSGTSHHITEPFARLVAQEVARQHPALVTAEMRKALRTRKVFIDWSQNAEYKTTVSVYSLRAKRDPPLVSMPVTWEEIERGGELEFEPAEALRRLVRRGDLFKRVLTLKQPLAFDLPRTKRVRDPRESPDVVLEGIRLPKPKSQSGRRLFLLVKAAGGNELWLDMLGRFKRWILRADQTSSETLIAMPAGDFPIDLAYYRGEVPKAWRQRVTLDDLGAYEVIEGSYQQRRFALWFTGRVLTGPWTLEKVSPDARHRSWRLARA